MNSTYKIDNKEFVLHPVSRSNGCRGCYFMGSNQPCPRDEKGSFLCHNAVFKEIPVVVEKHTVLDELTNMLLPTDSEERKKIPITTGVLDYFPLAIAEVAKASYNGNLQHHPNKELHWDKTKSTDHSDCIARHLVDRGKFDTDGIRHSAKLAWRSLALLQLELEKE